MWFILVHQTESIIWTRHTSWLNIFKSWSFKGRFKYDVYCFPELLDPPSPISHAFSNAWYMHCHIFIDPLLPQIMDVIFGWPLSAKIKWKRRFVIVYAKKNEFKNNYCKCFDSKILTGILLSVEFKLHYFER